LLCFYLLVEKLQEVGRVPFGYRKFNDIASLDVFEDMHKLQILYRHLGESDVFVKFGLEVG